MAEGFAWKLGEGKVEAWSAGSKPSGKINEIAVQVMREAGADISANFSKGLKDLPAVAWDTVVTMGCGDACPLVAARGRLDWNIPDPKGKPIEEVRKIRDEIARLVAALIRDMVDSPL